MEYTRITFRIPVDLHQELMEASEENSRSMNAEIIARLRLASGLPDGEEQTLTAAQVRQIVREELRTAKNLPDQLDGDSPPYVVKK
ncbi:Arc family DNA-binding protein [Thiothrix subterranea]|uniref:Arc family DNA-binding protein n=1 Tax=Thiothrix subterranea TaxID=2735563 RepID=UPI00192AF97F|nr:Arc family DNA-binding protein [Thiothrix subterranea]QQZ27616.1 Arc family DNA-binding protein [Thiothrix subterranea]